MKPNQSDKIDKCVVRISAKIGNGYVSCQLNKSDFDKIPKELRNKERLVQWMEFKLSQSVMNFLRENKFISYEDLIHYK